MAEDIVPGLQEAIEKDFQNSFQTDSTLISIYEKVQNGTATQKDGEAFARELGTVLTDVFHRNVTPEQLPDGRMYYNIANRLIPPSLEQNHGLVNEVMRQIITKQNADAGIGLRYQDADLDEDKVHGLVERAANYPQYEVVQNDVETGLTTFTQGVADDAVHKNAAFQASAGLHPRIVRETDGDCCKWCLDLAGTYDYESAPPEVYARHANCGCSVEFRPGDGKRQDVWSKALISDAEPAKIEARKEIEGVENDRLPEKIGTRISETGVSADRHVNYAKGADLFLLEDITPTSEITPDAVAEHLETSPVGREVEMFIQKSGVRPYLIYERQPPYVTERGSCNKTSIKVFISNCQNVRVAAQTVIHEMTHYRYNIGMCQHAEAICFAFEKMHIMQRDWLTEEEWAYVKQLAVSAYPEYKWEDGGYGDYTQFNFVRDDKRE